MSLEDLIADTQAQLGALITKPKLSEKLVRTPAAGAWCARC